LTALELLEIIHARGCIALLNDDLELAVHGPRGVASSLVDELADCGAGVENLRAFVREHSASACLTLSATLAHAEALLRRKPKSRRSAKPRRSVGGSAPL
jgi:hypothetical protein